MNRSPVFDVGRVKQSGSEIYTNPIKEALKYRGCLDRREVKSQADLAKKLGVSRAKVTQMLNLLELDDEIKACMLRFEETDKRLGTLTERRLRKLLQLSVAAQKSKFWELLRGIA